MLCVTPLTYKRSILCQVLNIYIYIFFFYCVRICGCSMSVLNLTVFLYESTSVNISGFVSVD